MNIQEILQLESPSKVIEALKDKPFNPPAWSDLEKQYDPKKHKVMDKAHYPDIATNGEPLREVSRVTFDLERLAVKRSSEITFANPPIRDYQFDKDNDNQAKVAEIIESVFKKVRINSINFTRAKYLFASCEVITLWYEVETPETYGGEKLKTKFRVRTFSPMKGDELYPLFDDSGDLVALSIQTKVKDTTYFDTYTAERHYQWSKGEKQNEWQEELAEDINIVKIPAIYMVREQPAWEDNSDKRAEMEWLISRNGNYITDNSKPLLMVYADYELHNDNPSEASDPNKGKGVYNLPQGARAEFVTWEQSVENIKNQFQTLKEAFFTSLQIPDISYSEMKTTPMSGEARKQLFIDAILKSIREAGAWLEALDREVNIVKAFLKTRLPQHLANEVDNVDVEYQMRPFVLDDEKERINLIVTAHGAKILSTQEAVKRLGWVDDTDQEVEAIQTNKDLFQPYD